ncbi:hypothetical protein AX17_000062 [Amanita inopinata Kibby_2008]|nr:hypothetical protein AX17_000062 [Amanita inopinata Kibby_2008]
MAAQKRPFEDASTTPRAKKSKIANSTRVKTVKPPQPASNVFAEEVDFPRGGGTSLTPAEVKTIRAEAVKEANEELFRDTNEKKAQKRKRGSEASKVVAKEKNERTRIEHLNYKRLSIGMKILGQVVSIQPLALIISLPNQLFAHVPITNISTQYTNMLESADEVAELSVSEERDSEDEGDGDDKRSPAALRCPELKDMFRVGQYVRAVVTAVHVSGNVMVPGISKSRDELVRASKRVELSLSPENVNAGVQKSDLRSGFTLTAAVKSVEDHGYILDLGIPDVSGFLSFKDAKQSAFELTLHRGLLLDITVSKLSKHQRNCDVSIDRSLFSSSYLSEAAHANSILPGILVQSLVTAVTSSGLNLQVLGLFDGTVDEFQMPSSPSEKAHKVGQRIKARVLYSYDSSPPKFALTLTDHVLRFKSRIVAGPPEHPLIEASEAYPVGTILDSVKIAKIEAERGIIVDLEGGLKGFIHISHLSDEHIPSIPTSGPWKLGSFHRARVTGYFAFDGLLQLSLRPSVINEKFFKINDVEVGQIVKGTVKKLTDSGLFVVLSGNIHGVVWPNHYADITLKHPARRFKPGISIKCRVLVVDSNRERICLTAKKTLIESTLPVLSKMEDIRTGVVTHAVVFRVSSSTVMVEFYNNMKAIVPAKELSETIPAKLSELYPIGKVVKVRIIAVEREQPRIIASIRQAAPNFSPPTVDISGIEIGDTVEGEVLDIHKDNVILTLQPSRVRALLSLKNLANHRGMSLAQLRIELKVRDTLDKLIVVTRNSEKGFVIVANKPQAKTTLTSKGSPLTMNSVEVGQMVLGRVTRHNRQGTLLKINAHIGGLLHPTDACDDYDIGNAFPPVDTILKATVLELISDKKQLVLSTRGSRMYPNKAPKIVDREVRGLGDLHVGDVVRGFIKNVTEHGLFVAIARDIDARVQIRELFDEYVKDWKPRFQTNQLVKGRILSVDAEDRKVEMTFKSDDLARRKASNLRTSELQKGQIVDGVVKKIESYGLFIQINDSKLQGLCHKSELSDNSDADVVSALQGFREGDSVKAIVLSVEQRRISLSIKPSHFNGLDSDVSHDRQGEKENDGDGQLGVQDQDIAGNASDTDSHANSDDADAEQSDDADSTGEIDVADIHYMPKSTKALHDGAVDYSSDAPMNLSGFHWFGAPDDLEDNEAVSPYASDDSDAEHQPSKKRRKKRKEIEQDLTADMHTRTPESNADFERLLLGSPNSSYLWIQYMSFQLRLSEIDKARELARRAIRTINFREEQERLNVWIALLNLENIYGTDETLEKTFREAARANDSKTVHLRLVSIFDESGKHDKAEGQYEKTCKKFSQSSKVWTSFGEFHLLHGKLEEARRLLPRSLQCLEKRKHLKTISKFAQLEYKHGDPERGKTLFEGIVDSHPKRWDLWSIYMDMEAKHANIQGLRNLFDRALALKMTSHKAKSFFKKWLDLERKLGDEEGASVVKQKAIEWTKRANPA